MENAGRGAVEAMVDRYGPLRGETVVIVAGPGNNGGDGFVMARHLYQIGARPEVFVLVEPDTLKGDAATNASIVKKLSIPFHSIISHADIDSTHFRQHLAGCRVVVDAIFGTGLKCEVAGHMAEVIGAINDSGRPVVAVDIPSGLDSDSGRPLGSCIEADCTVTFGLAKPGLMVQPGVGFCGVLKVVDIGIPAAAVDAAVINLELLERDTIGGWLPERRGNDHKGTFGHILIIAGSQGKTGAALLAGKGALRSGAGLVTLCVPQHVHEVFEFLPEAMLLPLQKSTAGHLVVDDYECIKDATVGKKAIVVGPGLGALSDTAEVVKRLYTEINIPMVIDADGLNILAGDGSLIKKSPATRILTPHPGEMARLIGKTTAEVQADRICIASDFAQGNNVLTVLKGAVTVIAAPDGHVALNPTGNPGMATAGMGDVLAGLIGGLLAQGLSPWRAACLGVFVHGLSADMLVAESGIEAGILASEVADGVPFAFDAIRNG
jgi:NAD(P)H-hydrate epimerase